MTRAISLLGILMTLVATGSLLGGCAVSPEGIAGAAGEPGGTGRDNGGGTGGRAGSGAGAMAGDKGDAAIATDGLVLPCKGATGLGKAPGQSCACAGECASGFCADGVCCEEACSGACRTCATAGAAGKCKLVASGATDPRKMCAAQPSSSCGTTGLCDGQGDCTVHASGTACGAAGACEGTRFRAPSQCDGKGICATGAYLECSPFTCMGSACRTRCESSSQCATGLTCENGSCVGLRDNAAACTVGSQCASGQCVDGVCCAEACPGECRSCALPASRGACRLVPAGQTGTREECTADAANACGRSGACNGEGRCAVRAAGTTCQPPSCVDSTERAASSCDGAGTCVAGMAKSCAPYTCGGAGACLQSCSTDKACSAAGICVLGLCGVHPILDVKAAPVSPVADGIAESVWLQAQAHPITRFLIGSGSDNFSAIFKALWTPTALHLLVVVQDSQIVKDSPGVNSYDDDTVEVYLDADGSRGTALDGQNDHHILFGWGNTQPSNVSLRLTKDIAVGQSPSPGGYTMEISLPWNTLGTNASAGNIVGLDLHVNDDDDGGTRDRKIAWFTTQDVSFRDPSSYGRIRLAP